MPLSPQAIDVFKQAASLGRSGTDLVFPNGKGELLSDMTLTKCLRDMGERDTIHGFRSTFRDWVAEELLEIPDEIAEAALSHTVPDKIMAAYKRTTFFAKRRDLMDIWGRYATSSKQAEIHPISRATERRR